MITVTIYYGEKGVELDQLLADLDSLQSSVPHRVVTIDLSADRALQEKLGRNFPVIEIGPYHLQPPFSRQDLQIMLGAARDRIDQLETIDDVGFKKKLEKGRNVNSGDKLSIWLSKHYLAMINLLLLIYVGLPFLAPVLLNSGHPLIANIIYRFYGTMCHQLAFRSWFLFGEQPYYPSDMAGIPGVLTYEIITDSNEIDLLAARSLNGNETIGYKVALCQRDVAIYAFMLLFGITFTIFGRRFRSIPWYFWLVFGLVPIGVDGFSQLVSYIPFLAQILPVRESNPLLRTLTGGLFGWITAWYLFPMLEDTARETRQMMQRKLAVIQQTSIREKAK